MKIGKHNPTIYQFKNTVVVVCLIICQYLENIQHVFNSMDNNMYQHVWTQSKCGTTLS